VASTHALAATTRLRVGTGVCLVAQRDPILTAKEVASVDRLSGGRFEFGVGAGWNREEMESHGTDPRLRMAVLAEKIEAMKTIWAEEEATFHGRFVDLDRIRSWPKPAQKPHPPILVGGHGPKVLDRVLSFGDAWFPNFGEAANLAERIAELRARADRPIEVHVMNAPADAATMEELFEIGATRVGHWLPTGTRSVVLPALERWEIAIAELFGEQ
jgi:probable F420-dependent oxidoreductase